MKVLKGNKARRKPQSPLVRHTHPFVCGILKKAQGTILKIGPGTLLAAACCGGYVGVSSEYSLQAHKPWIV